MNEQVNLSNCDREPIQLPGSVQPFGFLLTLLSDSTICMASENVGEFLGIEVAALLQRHIDDVFTAEAISVIRGRVEPIVSPAMSAMPQKVEVASEHQRDGGAALPSAMTSSLPISSLSSSLPRSDSGSGLMSLRPNPHSN